MAVEIITPDMVRINGYFVEIRDSRTPDYFDELSERDNAVYRPNPAPPIRDLEFRLLRGPLTAEQFNPEYMAYQQIPRFIDMARRAAAERAISYRDYKVGASVCALSTSDMRMGYLFGANLKAYKSAPKRCAEMETLRKAKERGFDKILALAVFGPVEFADVQELEAPTLHPCNECRAELRGDRAVSGNALVVTGNDTGAMELMTVDDLMELHER